MKKGGAELTVYQSQCAACHGPDRKGSPPAFPSLIEASKNLTTAQMTEVIHNGRGRMPGYPDITATSLQALLDYVLTGQDAATVPGAQAGGGGFGDPSSPPPVAARSDKEEAALGSGANPAQVERYRFTGYHKFLDPDGYPAVVPPWGTLNAVDLNTGKFLWKIPLGEYPELAAKGMKNTGSENYGGPIVTAGGLVIIGATNFDHKIRAFDSRSGKLLWEYTMEYSGNATPATYMVDGKQYIVIAVSNARDRTGPQGAKYVAFALRSTAGRNEANLIWRPT